MTLPIGTRIGEKTILQFLGSGSYGEIYKVDTPEGIYALKIMINPRKSDRERIFQEYQLVRKLHSPYIVKYEDLFECQYRGQPTWCLLMEYFDGTNLYDYIVENRSRKKRYSQNGILERYWMELDDLFLKVSRQLFSALYELHRHELVHSDIKPDNILYNGEKILLIDMGFICQSGWCFENMGTPGYMAPEQIDYFRFTYPDHRPRDIWAAGITLFELISGKCPYDEHSDLKRASLDQEIFWDLIPRPEYRQILAKILIIDPRSRPTAEEILKMNL